MLEVGLKYYMDVIPAVSSMEYAEIMPRLGKDSSRNTGLSPSVLLPILP